MFRTENAASDDDRADQARWSWAINHTGRLHATTTDAEPGKGVGSLCGDVAAVTGLLGAVGDLDLCLGCLTLLHLIGGSPCGGGSPC